jgi:hypothetical protein
MSLNDMMVTMSKGYVYVLILKLHLGPSVDFEGLMNNNYISNIVLRVL